MRFDDMVQHYPILLATARRLCRTSFDANDLVQDTFERAWKNFDRLRPGTNARAWLLTILTNLFVDQLRRVKREPRRESIDDLPLAAPDTAPEPEPLKSWEAVTPAELHQAITQLSEKLRVVYRMHCIEGADYAFIAEELGIPKNTVGTRLLSARQKLRELLAPRLVAQAA